MDGRTFHASVQDDEAVFFDEFFQQPTTIAC